MNEADLDTEIRKLHYLVWRKVMVMNSNAAFNDLVDKLIKYLVRKHDIEDTIKAPPSHCLRSF